MELNASNPTAKFLVNHAALNVNCRPQLDNQHRIKMLRISHFLGVTKTFTAFNRNFTLPDDENTYHVFAIGRHLGEDFNVGASKMFWRNLSDFCNGRGTYFNIYTEAGLEFPLTTVWTGNLENDIMLVCVLAQPRIADAGIEDLYWRTYANANYADPQNGTAEAKGRQVQILGGVVVLSADVLVWQRQYHEWQAEIKVNGYGWTYCSINGQRVNDIPPNSFNIGDSIQIVYDKTVIRQHLFTVESLKTYTSDLDKKNKYLLHPPKNSKDNRIQYRDDVDVYIRNKKGVGRYYHCNLENAIRMVTHRDYGVPVDYISFYVGMVPETTSLRDLTIELIVRESGLPIALSFEHNRIHELYKLTDENIIKAMVELNANIPEFHAARLEESNYTRIMREYESQITIDQVTDAYGYNAMAKLVADSPQIIDNALGVRAAPVPWGLRNNATYFEYDKNGLLLGITQHPGGQWFYPQFDETHYAEGRSGVGGRYLDYVLGMDGYYPLREWASYRCYKTKLVNGNPDPTKWKDVTGDPTAYIVEDGLLQWNVTSNTEAGMIVFDTWFLAYQTKINHRNHTVWLDITQGMNVEYPLPFEPELIEIWIGDESGEKSYSLIKNYDYTVVWPTVMINAKRFFPETDIKTVTVRCTGFPQANLKGLPQPDHGWTKHGLLGYDDIFHVRDDHVVRVVVGGRIFDRDEVVAHEDTQYPQNLKVPDGTPYAIFRVAPPIRGLITDETYYLRGRSLETDKRVSDYMSLYFPIKDLSDEILSIENPYQLISCTLLALTYDILNGVLVPKPDLQEMELDAYLEPYKWFLDFDPALREYDERFISIHPHDQWKHIDVTLDAYRFLERVSRDYLRNKIDFTRFYTVKGV